MLAQHLRRLQRPIRYAALDPAHAQAIYNFLKLQSRVYGIPEMMGSPENQRLLGNAHPLGMQMAQQLHHGDNEAAVELPDLMEEHGALPVTGGQQGGNLLFQLLHGIRNRLVGHNGGADPGMLHGYGQGVHDLYGTEHRQMLHGVAARVSNLRHFLHPAQSAAGAGLQGVWRALYNENDASALPHAYDAAQRYGTPAVQDYTLNTLNHMNDFMAGHAGM